MTYSKDFEEFWAAYPRHVAKADAFKAWTRIKPSPLLLEWMLEALAWQTLTPGWTKDGGAYVPYPATWLRAERWDDEPLDTRPVTRRLDGGMRCPHRPTCRNFRACTEQILRDAREQRAS